MSISALHLKHRLQNSANSPTFHQVISDRSIPTSAPALQMELSSSVCVFVCVLDEDTCQARRETNVTVWSVCAVWHFLALKPSKKCVCFSASFSSCHFDSHTAFTFPLPRSHGVMQRAGGSRGKEWRWVLFIVAVEALKHLCLCSKVVWISALARCCCCASEPNSNYRKPTKTHPERNPPI